MVVLSNRVKCLHHLVEILRGEIDKQPHKPFSIVSYSKGLRVPGANSLHYFAQFTTGDVHISEAGFYIGLCARPEITTMQDFLRRAQECLDLLEVRNGVNPNNQTSLGGVVTVKGIKITSRQEAAADIQHRNTKLYFRCGRLGDEPSWVIRGIHRVVDTGKEILFVLDQNWFERK